MTCKRISTHAKTILQNQAPPVNRFDGFRDCHGHKKTKLISLCMCVRNKNDINSSEVKPFRVWSFRGKTFRFTPIFDNRSRLNFKYPNARGYIMYKRPWKCSSVAIIRTTLVEIKWQSYRREPNRLCDFACISAKVGHFSLPSYLRSVENRDGVQILPKKFVG